MEQVLKEKSASFYNEIEGLVHNYLSSIGHYSRIERQKAGMESIRLPGNTSSFSTAAYEGEKPVNKLSDKEIDDFIKEETTRFLEATAEEKMKEKMARLTDGLAGSIEESLPPGNDDNVIEMDAAVNEENAEPDNTKEPDSSVLDNSPKPADVIPTSSQDILKEADDTLAEALLKLPSQNANEIEKSSVEKSDALSPKGKEQIEEDENSTSDDNKPISKEDNRLEIAKDVQSKIAEKKTEATSPNPVPNLKVLPMSTGEETDDNGDSGIRKPLVSEAYLSEDESEEANPKVSELDIELSDSDITVSSVHTSDLSSLDDSLSDLEFKDFEATSKILTIESTSTKGLSTTDASDAMVGSLSANNHEATSDADDEAAIGNSDSGNQKPGSSRDESRQASSQQESEGSDERILAPVSEEQRDAVPQRRSARVASKDRFKVDEKDEVPNVSTKNPSQASIYEESRRRVRRKRREIKEEKKRRMADSKEDVDEMGQERPHRRELRITSDSNESEYVKQSKRSRRTIRPTRCYSPSENN